MVVRIVTDSGADLPGEIIKDLNIAVVPLHILFGKKDFRDGLDMGHEELYQLLAKGSVMPTTSTASPGEFANVFRKVIERGAESIICISISDKLSKTYGSAVQAKGNAGSIITVIDSENVAMGMGFLVMLAARLAKEGKGHQEIVNAVKENISRVRLMGALDTLKYLIKGGRAPKLAVVSDILKLKNFITIREGEVHAAGRVRTQQDKTNRLMSFVESFTESGIEAVAVEYGTNREEAEALVHEMEGKFPEARFYTGILGAVLGVHVGPGVIAVSVKTKS